MRRQLGLLSMYDDGKRYHVNIHAFRANYITHATKVLGGDIAHAMIGHHQYMDVYLRLTQDDKNKLYHTLEPYLTISDEARQRVIIEEKDQQISELNEMKIEISKAQLRTLLYYAHAGSSLLRRDYVKEFPKREQPWQKVYKIELMLRKQGVWR